MAAKLNLAFLRNRKAIFYQGLGEKQGTPKMPYAEQMLDINHHGFFPS